MSSENRSGYLFKWRIENFSFCYDCSLYSPHIVEKEGGTIWYMFLSFRAQSVTKRFIVFRLFRARIDDSVDEPEVMISFKIELVGPSEKIIASFEGKNVSSSCAGHIYESNEIDADLIMRDIAIINRDILTFYCHIYDINSSKIEQVTSEAITKIQVNRQSFKLKLPYAELDAKTEKHISVSRNEEICIKLCKNEDFINILVSRINNEISFSSKYNLLFRNNLLIELRLILLNGNLEQSLIGKHLFTYKVTDEDQWEFPLLLYSENIAMENCLINGDLEFLCEIACSGDNIMGNSNSLFTRQIRHQNTKWDASSFSTLQENLYDMFCSKKFCDVKLKIPDGVISAHKCVLASQSPVLSTMFDQDMLEAQTGNVTIPDMDNCTLNLFVKFLYTDKVDNMDIECATKLIIVADKYQVLSLKEKCAFFFKSHLSVENACDVVKLSDMVYQKDLKASAIDFIVANSKIIFAMPEWIPWMKNNMELATEIFSKLMENVTLS